MSNLQIKLTLIGGPSLLIEVAGLRFLTDPTFDPPIEYETNGFVYKKNRGPAISAEAVGTVDAVLLSHDQHFDNLDHAGRAFLAKAKNTFTTKVAAVRLGPSVTGLAPWETVRLESGLHVTATPARHGPPGIEPMIGDVVGFALGIDQPGDAVYITGDTVWYEGVAEIARRFKPRLVVVFTGSAKPRGSYHVTMDTNDAIETAHAFPQAKIVAIHNDGWAHFTETQAELAKSFSLLGIASRLETLDLGKPVTLTV